MLIFTSMCVTAQYKELLKDVDEDRIEKISDYNRHALGDAAYFAKRFRIVEVNSDLFFEAEAFIVTPFIGDSPLVLARDSLKKQPLEGSATWLGTIIDPYVPMSEFKVSEEQLAQSGMSKAQLYNTVFGVRFYMLDWDSDGQTGNAYLSSERKKYGKVSQRPVEVPELSNIEERAFRSVSGQINLNIFGLGRYVLKPLQFMPKYHVIYEVDPLKKFSVPEDKTDRSLRAQEQREKAQLYEDYRETLPKFERKVIKGDIK